MYLFFSIAFLVQTLAFCFLVFHMKKLSDLLSRNLNSSKDIKSEPTLKKVKKIKEATYKSLNLNSNIVLTIESKLPYVFIFFSPGCKACEELIEKVVTNTSLYNNINLVLITNKKDNLEKYITALAHYNTPIMFSKTFSDSFGIKGYPTVVITNKSLDVIDVFVGANINKILDHKFNAA